MRAASILPAAINILQKNGPMRPRDLLVKLDAVVGGVFHKDKPKGIRAARLATILAGACGGKEPKLTRDRQTHTYSVAAPGTKPPVRRQLPRYPEHWTPKSATLDGGAFLIRNLLEVPTIERVIVEQELQLEGKHYLLVRCL